IGPSGKASPSASTRPCSCNAFILRSLSRVNEGIDVLASTEVGVYGLLASFAAVQRLCVKLTDNVPMPQYPRARRQLGGDVEALFDQECGQLLILLYGG